MKKSSPTGGHPEPVEELIAGIIAFMH